MWSYACYVAADEGGLFVFSLTDTLWLGRHSNAGKKLNLLHIINLTTCVLVMWKYMGLLLMKNLLVTCWDCLLLNCIRVLTWFLMITVSKNFCEVSFCEGCTWSLSVFYPALHGILHGISGIVLLIAAWICWITYKNSYIRLLDLNLLLHLYPWFTIEMNSV